MKLRYTDMMYDMTECLVEEAKSFVAAGKRVFYIAPNSLSFEKERAVLEKLTEQASFQITVTRFVQLSRYLLPRKTLSQFKTIDDTGLLMLFFKVLSDIPESHLKIFGALKQDMSFVTQLRDLYKELKQAQLTVFDLEDLDIPEKYDDLLLIFSKVDALLEKEDYANQSPLTFFANELASHGALDIIKDCVIIIDGFTRFSAEEDYLVSLLEKECAEVIIGTYISQKAYKSSFSQGNSYQAGIDFMRNLAGKYATKPKFVRSRFENQEAIRDVSCLVEVQHDFTYSGEKLAEQYDHRVVMWEFASQKSEIEGVAQAIRNHLYQGYRYKDILVLLGDVDSYALQVKQIFDRYDIPFYIAQSESMSAHPLVHLIESLERLKIYHFQTEDVMTLFKSGLYGNVVLEDLDYFEQYVLFANIKGASKFFNSFTVNPHNVFDLDKINSLRKRLCQPLEPLFKAQKQYGKNLLQKLFVFFEAISLSQNMADMVKDSSLFEIEKNEEVWKNFSDILQQFHLIFADEKVTLEDMLSLLKNAILSANYRTVPATIDVVAVKSYDLVEPHTNKFVFALGMTRGNFPKTVQNKSLVSDDERLKINEKVEGRGYLDVLKQDNIKKNHFTALSLINAAKERLVLSIPQAFSVKEEEQSPYLVELKTIGVPLLDKTLPVDDLTMTIGTDKSLLSQIISFYQLDIRPSFSQEEETFWTVATRYLQKKLDENAISMPHITDRLSSKTVSPRVIEARFKDNIPLSTSALTSFYNNQYYYYLQYVLGLKSNDKIHPDARNHGQYLHRVFEVLLKDKSDRAFDDKLGNAISQVQKESDFQMSYGNDQEGRYSLNVLESILKSNAPIFAHNDMVTSEQEEERFSFYLKDNIHVKGIIDRVDRLTDQSLGVVDYKSSATNFDLGKFYNGLNSQLVTYIDALKEKRSGDIFGAMYLHLQEPKINFSDVKSHQQILENLHKNFTYKGIFLENQKGLLSNGYYQLRDSVYSEEEVQLLLDYNHYLFEQAAAVIKSGHFLINPYSEDGKTVKGEQFKAITGFEADRHMSYARQLSHLPRKDKKIVGMDKMKARLDDLESGENDEI